MKTKNNSKRVEKTYSYYLAQVKSIVVQQEDERGASVVLEGIYQVAYTDTESLSKFILQVKSDPIKFFKSHFCFCTPLQSVVTVDYIEKDFYSIREKTTKKQLIVVSCSYNLRFRDKLNHNRNLIQYKSEI